MTTRGYTLPCADCGAESALAQSVQRGALVYCLDCAAAYVPSRDTRPQYAGPWQINPVNGQAVAPGREGVKLTRTELGVLLALRASPGVVTQADIAWRLWGGINANLVRKHVQRLRKKLGADIIITVPGFGYRLTPGE